MAEDQPPPQRPRLREDPYGDDAEWRAVGDPKKMPRPSPVPPWVFVGIPTLMIVVIVLAFALK
jgi:hypothetical protein